MARSRGGGVCLASAGENEWFGQWVILSGTGELENLNGRGTWWEPSFHLYYSGRIHFVDDDYDFDDD